MRVILAWNTPKGNGCYLQMRMITLLTICMSCFCQEGIAKRILFFLEKKAFSWRILHANPVRTSI